MYKHAINICCMPECPSGVNLNTHHILPLYKGGKDDYDNYIVLCQHCHRHNRLHSRHEKRKMEILVYKIYMEKIRVGYCSNTPLERDKFAWALYKVAGERYKEVQEEESPTNYLCKINGCDKTAKAKGYCCSHYCQYIAPNSTKKKKVFALKS